MLEILDDMRRDSIKAINAPVQKKMYGLTVRQGSAISQLKLMQEDAPEGVSLKSLAQRMQMTIPATSLLVEVMVSKGFMERNPNPNDRRAVCIKLTERGLSLFDDVYARFHDEIDRRAQVLTQEELNAFSCIVEKMSK
ncbi:MAG: MarR family transcriptional regulator [Akkermansia sp.]|nr:MarR family transcriptional regulator [Akkermansia sp.]